jgi:hypothetical protein
MEEKRLKTKCAEHANKPSGQLGGESRSRNTLNEEERISAKAKIEVSDFNGT